MRIKEGVQVESGVKFYIFHFQLSIYKMDSLIKRNIVKANRIVVDVGESNTKVLGLHYAGGKVSVTGSCDLQVDGEFNVGGLSNAVKSCIKATQSIKNGDIILSIPESFAQYKLDSVRNIKMSGMDKHIRANHQLNNVSEQTHIIDWSYLGEREENGDTLKYYLVGAVNKNVVRNAIDEFSKQGLNVTGITFSVNNMVCLCDLWRDDFEYPNRLYIHVGTNNTRILVECAGTVVYSRIIDTPINKLQNEIIRVVRMCGNDGIDISKIICFGNIPDKTLEEFSDSGISVEIEDCKLWYELDGDGYTLSLVNTEVESDSALSIGAGLTVMQKRKSLNLLPYDHKEKQATKLLGYIFGGVLAVFALVLAISYAHLCINKYTLNNLKAETTAYEQKNIKLEALHENIKSNSAFIADYKRPSFQFYEFMRFIEEKKPYGLTILSIDSMDRFEENTVPAIEEKNGNDSETEEKTEDDIATKEPDAPTTIDTNQNSALRTPHSELTSLSVRGYSTDPVDISLFLNDLSLFTYVTDLELKSLEEHTMGGEIITVFECILQVGGMTI